MVREMVNRGLIVVLLRVQLRLSGNLGLDAANAILLSLRDALVHVVHGALGTGCLGAGSEKGCDGKRGCQLHLC